MLLLLKRKLEKILWWAANPTSPSWKAEYRVITDQSGDSRWFNEGRNYLYLFYILIRYCSTSAASIFSLILLWDVCFHGNVSNQISTKNTTAVSVLLHMYERPTCLNPVQVTDDCYCCHAFYHSLLICSDLIILWSYWFVFFSKQIFWTSHVSVV